MVEEWKDIKGYEGYYQVSNLGRVKSLPHKVRVRGNNNYRISPEKMRNVMNVGGGYKQICLHKNNTHKYFCVHRLVAEAFIPNPNNYPCVNHKDENPSNNCVDNLEWCTYKYNSNYGTIKKKQSECMKKRYNDLDTLHPNIPKSRSICQLDMNFNLIHVYDAIHHAVNDGFNLRHIRHCADCLGGHWNKPTHHGFSKSHKGYRWMWLDEYEEYMSKQYMFN